MLHVEDGVGTLCQDGIILVDLSADSTGMLMQGHGINGPIPITSTITNGAIKLRPPQPCHKIVLAQSQLWLNRLANRQTRLID